MPSSNLRPLAEPTVYDSRGRPARLGAEIGRGGEGSVWEVQGLSAWVAKLYREPTVQQSAKLGAMLRLGSERLHRAAAWPVGTLHDRRGDVCGFLMPKAAGRPIHLLYGPKSRLSAFPRATWPFLIQAAANLARAFAVVHAEGLVVGDVNHSNSLVSEQATVTLIDCDSFQIPNAGHPFLCGVGVETHVPPELQGKDLSALLRTPNHDAFGLAVLLFQILFMGRHPFSGRYLGGGDMTIPRSIQELRFAYGTRAAARQMQPPPNTLPLEALPPTVSALFERAFSQEGISGNRPLGPEWAVGLDQLGRELRTCRRNPAHHFYRALLACPWCEIEARSGVLLFGLWVAPVALPAGAGSFQLAAAWARIAAVPPPPPPPELPEPASFHPAPTAAAVAEGHERLQWIAAGILFALLGASLSYLTGAWMVILLPVCVWIARQIAGSGTHAVRQRTQVELQAAEAALSRLQSQWSAGAAASLFYSQLRELDEKRTAYGELPAQRQRRLAELQANLRPRQLERYLDGHRIERAKIKHIGPARRAVLQSYGVETAADVQLKTLLQIPGFGPTLARALHDWRLDLERRFAFDPKRGIDPADLQALDASLAAQRTQLESDLANGAAQMEQLRRTIEARRQSLLPLLGAAAERVAQLKADLKAAR